MSSRINIIKEAITKYDSNLLYDMDILALLLGEKIAISLEKNNIHTIAELKKCTDDELLKIPYIGKETLLKIKAVIELTKRNCNVIKDKKISSPDDIYEVCKNMMYNEQEVLKLICLNTKNEIIKDIDIFKGGLNSSVVDVKILMKEVIKNNSTSFIICHNHPSGDPTPSREDINVTLRLEKVGELLGCKLLDHIIIGNKTYISLKADGKI